MPPNQSQPSTKIQYMGVDPGYGGGMALLRLKSVALTKMPETETDIWNWVQLHLYQDVKTIAVIEKVHSMPGQGVSSSFKFGMSYGMLRMVLLASRIEFDEVSPQKWQKSLGVSPRRSNESKNQFKQRLRQFSQQLFPLESRKITLHTADALLLAKYCERREKGTL